MNNQYKQTKYRTNNGAVIYEQIRFDGLIRYKVKTQTEVLKRKGKYHVVSSVSSYRDVDPAECEELYTINPEGFTAYHKALLHDTMIANNQTWNERQNIHIGG